MIKRTNDKQS